MPLKRIFGGVLFTTLIASAWTIDGHVVDTDGNPVANASIFSFNYSGLSDSADKDGFFKISYEVPPARLGENFVPAKLNVQYSGSQLSIDNGTGAPFKIAIMDVLGKIAFQKEFHSRNVSLDLKKFASQKTMFMRLSSQASSGNYIPGKNGATRVALMKEDETTLQELLPVLAFSKEGYSMKTYNMTSAVETNVVITMKKADAVTSTSESSPATSSSSGSNVTDPDVSGSSTATSSNSAGPASSASASTPSADVKPAEVLKPGDYQNTIGDRLYIVHVPETYTGEKPVALVVDYHPLGGAAYAWINQSPYKSVTDQEGVITIYPHGNEQVWNVGSCCTNTDDEAFTRAFIDEVKKIAYIDSKRIYATGFSMGGGMSQFAACNMADIFAAIAPAGFDLAEENVNNCHPSRPISIISFRGTMDGVVSYAGHADPAYPDKPLTFLGAKENHKKWAEFNQCTGEPVNDANGCSAYENCAAGTKVVLCTDKNLASCSGNGHDAGCPSIGWPFLKQFTMP